MKAGSISVWNLGSVLFFGLFLLVGLLNVWYINPIIGAAYIILAMLYIPALDRAVTNQFQIIIPRGLKFLIALLVLWATLAVGDLYEVLGSWMRT